MLSARSGVLEIEKCIDIDDYREMGNCVEVGRLWALGEVRFSPVAMAMARAFYRYAIANDIRFLFITATQQHRRMYTHIGFRYLAGPFHSELLNNVFHDAYIGDLVNVPEDSTKRRPHMWEMFRQPMEGIG
jgi:hypothetical protein